MTEMAIFAGFRYEGVMQNLDEAFKRVAEIVKRLEQNDCSLDEALQLYEEGVRLTRACHAKLSEAERKIEILSKVDASGISTAPFESTADTN